MRPRLQRAKSRGFTLVELMAVVAITGILATIGVMLVIQHMRAASTHEAVAGMEKLRGLEESFRAQNGRYLDVSRTPGPIWYPAATPGKAYYSWTQDGADAQFWRQLGAASALETRFGYAVNAGLPGTDLPALQAPHTFTNTIPPTEEWYVIQVRGDRDGDGKFMVGTMTSWSPEARIAQESE